QSQAWGYDPVTDTWNTTRTSDPTPQAGAGTTISGQYIYLAGANGGSTVHNRYDIVNNAWVSMAAVPVPIFQPGSGNIVGQNYLFGGGDPFDSSQGAIRDPAAMLRPPHAPASTYNTTYIYDIASDSWISGPTLNAPHSFTGGTAIGPRLLIVAGYNGSGDTNVVEMASVCGLYTLSPSSSAFVPGVDDIGNHTDDGDTFIALPFPVTVYGSTYTTASAGSNGHLTFGVGDSNFGVSCPSPFGLTGTTYVLAPYWADQCTDNTGGCGTTCINCGIFTTTTGTAPNRVFYVEYRTSYYFGPLLDYEVALYENGSPPFRYIYNSIPTFGGNDSSLVVGVK